NDIGYNFLVDRFGTVYEGRYGGIDRNVVGAHAKGFNTGSVGVAVIGSFEAGDVPAAARPPLAALLAWRLDLAHVDPLTTSTVVSGGSDRFPAGIPVFLRSVSGHRDTGFTACPGNALYARLGEIAAETRAIGLPKLFEPRLTGSLGGPVRFRARLSEALPWTVAITDATGAELASGTGIGETIDWTWSSAGLPLAGVRWRIGAGATVTPASGTLGALAPGGGTETGPLAITGAAANPETISPNGDGAADATTLAYTTTTTATVDATLLDAAGAVVTQLLEPVRRPAGPQTLIFDGLGLPDGVYTVVVTAIGDDGVRVTSPVTVRLTRTLGQATLVPALFAPGAAGRPRRLDVAFQLAASAAVRVRILRDGRWVATPFSGALAQGLQLVGWDGAKRSGRALDGSYTAVVEATDAVGTASIALPFVKDTTAPRLRLLAGRRPRLWVSEPASLTVRVNGALRRLDATGPGPVALPGIRTLRTLVAVARDTAGNRTVLRRPR
ncbi:MAG: N-acetylmuramoyl-L-alanine amidase, partial [Gaiellaceae bacterium]